LGGWVAGKSGGGAPGARGPTHFALLIHAEASRGRELVEALDVPSRSCVQQRRPAALQSTTQVRCALADGTTGSTAHLIKGGGAKEGRGRGRGTGDGGRVWGCGMTTASEGGRWWRRTHTCTVYVTGTSSASGTATRPGPALVLALALGARDVKVFKPDLPRRTAHSNKHRAQRVWRSTQTATEAQDYPQAAAGT
jgi:hypothetical protein